MSGTADGRIPRREFAKRATVAGLGFTSLSSLLAACGSGAGSGSSGAGVSATIPAHARGRVSVLSANAHAPTPIGKALDARRAAWMKANPQASLNLDAQAGDTVAVVTTRSRAHKLADVLELLGERYNEAVFPALKPLTRDMFPDLKDALSLWDSTTLSVNDPGHQAGVPIGGSGAVWYYNKALFEQAGLDPEKTPETWAELTDIVGKLKAAGILPVAFAADLVGATNLWLPHLVQFLPTSADLASFRRGEIPLTDERFVHSLEPLVQAGRDGWWRKDFLTRTFTDMEAEFATGKAAMICGLIGGAANWPVWDQRLGKDAYGVFPAPTMPHAEKRVLWWYPDVMYSINKDSNNLPGALSFVNFLGSKEGLTLGLKIGGALPNRTDIDVAAVTGSKGADAIAQLVRTMPTVDVPIAFLSPAATTSVFKTLSSTLASGNIKDFLSTLQQQNTPG